MNRRDKVPLTLGLVALLLVPISAPVVGAKVVVPQFVDETAASGIRHVHSYGITPESPAGGWEYIVGGGLAVFDCDDDGLLDLYLAGGSGPASLYRNQSTIGGPLLFAQERDPSTDLVHVTGAYPIDLDSDGYVDLVVLRRGKNVILRGQGGCRFEPADEALGIVPEPGWTTAFSATWEAGSDLPTLAFGNYQALDEGGELVAGQCADHRLYRPDASGEAYADAIDLRPGWCALSMLFSDWDRSGRRDLRISNDRQYYVTAGEEQLWRLDANAAPHAYTSEDGWEREMIFGMGIASADVTGDGYPEVYLTTMGHNKLHTLEDGPGRPSYADIATDVGAATGRPVAGTDTRPSTAWHPEFDDLNNDGILDLYVSKGNLDAQPDHAIDDPSSALLGRPEGDFLEVAEAAGLANMARARGAAVVDLNLDGLLDIVEVNLGTTAEVWRNAGAGTPEAPAPMGNWLAVELAQDGPNSDAIGAWVEVETGSDIQTRELTVGGGHISGALGPTHFGLGDAQQARVRVIWPDGDTGAWMPVAADQRVRIERGAIEPLILASASVPTGASAASEAPEAAVPPPVDPVDPASCVRTADRSKSVARLWDEALLDAIRRDFPAPTVHARNLYHTSAAMWDAWAAYDPVADGVFVDEKTKAVDPAAARDGAISYAAYRILSHRYRDAVGGAESLHDFDRLMADLCYPKERTSTSGASAAALGNRIAARIVRSTRNDGSRETQGYTYPETDYRPLNEPMIVARPGTRMSHPNHWQPLALKTTITQNGQLLPVGPQQFVGPHWGKVASFALPSSEIGVPIDPGPPPLLGDPVTDAAFKAQVEEVIAFSRLLDPRDGVVVDISPASIGDNDLGTNDGDGHALNPITSEPYAPELVLRADFGRVLAEFWADGPDSETPPGHWNALANSVTDHPAFERRMGGVGEIVDPLEWDVKLYLALNGALHDAAVAAWGSKGHYDFTRPIAMIRHMGGLGQSSDPSLPSYHPDALPLSSGAIELITRATVAPGERHAHLADHVGEVAILAWAGNPGDTATDVGGVGWIRAVEWVPYQKASFVTPAFAGYVSGHSTFSRAAAEVMAAATGTPYFPGGLGTWTIPTDSLEFERGPEQDVELQWATYYDASDQAGISRLYGGIHIAADDLQGRIMGASCGRDAWALATRHFDGSARG